jgi:hypothetical protein
VPTDWTPNPDGENYALSRAITDIDAEVERFRDWHLTNGKKVADVAAAWRTWCRRSQEFAHRDRTSGVSPPSRQRANGQTAFLKETFAPFREPRE